ncbi:unnamed protein product, partial [Mesorhabditis belari]
MSWESYVFPVVGSIFISALSFSLGKFGYSFVWILIICSMHIVKSYLWKQRERRLMSLQATALREREVIYAQLQDLPAWVQFPDTERVEWLNKVIHQLWPYIGEYGKVFLTDVILPQVKAQMPAVFKNFKFTKMDMGDIPCRVGGVKVYTHNVGRDRIIVDMEVAYAGDSDFAISCCGFSGGMNQIQFSGKLRAVLKPLLPYPPMIGGISASFLEMPKIDFNLTGMGEFVELPGLMNAIRSVLNSQVAAFAVLPNEIVVPLAPNVDVTRLFFPEPDGVVRLKIIEAKNLENRDISFIKKGKSDPYCEVQVGSQYFKTRTIDDDLNPVFNEYFEAVVDQADGQKLRIEVFDEDRGQDEELGRLSINLANIQQKGTVQKWFPLEGCKHGDLHIKATWLNLSTNIQHLEQQEWETEWLQANRPIHPALLMVYVDSVADLPYPKSKLEPSPFVEVSLGKETQRTPVKVKTVNPLYQVKFFFFVRHPENQELKFEAIDDGTRKSLGTMSIPLQALIKEPNLEFYQQTLHLTHGVHQCPMVVTVRLRILVEATRKDSILGNNGLYPGEKNMHELDDDTLKVYATGSHIERADRKLANGDASAVEPAKTVNPKAGPLEVEVKMDSTQFHLNHSGSINSMASTKSPGHTSSRVGRLFKSRHELDKTLPSDAPRGALEISIRYADAVGKLILEVTRARNLLPVDKQNKTADPYVVCKLISIDSKRVIEKRKTGISHNTIDPVFDNHFEFDMNKSDMHNYRLSFEVKDSRNYGIATKIPVLGQADIRLERLDRHELSQQWITLEATRK